MKRLLLIVLAFFFCLAECAAEPPKLDTYHIEKGKHTIAVVKFESEIDEDLVNQVITDLEHARADKVDAVVIEVSSGGGEIEEGFRIIRYLEDYQLPVTCVVDGEAGSMAFAVLQSCQKRLMTERSMLMGHEPAIGVRGNLGPNDYKAISDRLYGLYRQLVWQYGHRSKLKREQIIEKTTGGLMWWIGPDEALKDGFVDGIVQTRKEVRDALKR